jgi:hypothetical protein
LVAVEAPCCSARAWPCGRKGLLEGAARRAHVSLRAGAG